jgi:hypothetical protein
MDRCSVCLTERHQDERIVFFTLKISEIFDLFTCRSAFNTAVVKLPGIPVQVEVLVKYQNTIIKTATFPKDFSPFKYLKEI